MQKYDVHFCVISEQAAANLLPVLDPSFTPKEAVFLVSQKMQEEADYLEKVFEVSGIKVTQKRLSNVFDFETSEKEISYVVEEYKNKNIALNATGGNKILSIAAYNAFSARKKAVFYVDTQNKKITFLSKDQSGKYIKDFVFEAKGEIERYLAAYGVKSIKDNYKVDNKSLNEMVECFIDNFETNNDYILYLNTAASKLENFKHNIRKEEKEEKWLEDEHFLMLLLRLKNANKGKGIIGYSDDTIDFRNAKNRFFVNGGWLEDFIYKQLSESKFVANIYCGLKVDNDTENTNDDKFDNELDVVFMANNKLHIVECKAGKISTDAGNTILYKLESLKKYGGSMTKTCLVSYSQVPRSVKERAKNMGVHIIEGKQLKKAKEKLEEWIVKRG